MRVLIILSVALFCTGCANNISPLNVLPGSELHVGEYPNLNTHSSNPSRAPIAAENVEGVISNLKAKARQRTAQ